MELRHGRYRPMGGAYGRGRDLSAPAEMKSRGEAGFRSTHSTQSVCPRITDTHACVHARTTRLVLQARLCARPVQRVAYYAARSCARHGLRAYQCIPRALH
eukprot:3685575-Rhodomonas_salina.2